MSVAITFIVRAALFLIYSGLFYAILGWLGVKQSRIVRSMILAVLLTVSELLSGIVADIFPVPLLSFILSTALVVLIFYAFVKNLLVLKTWQAIAIPVGVNIAGYLILGIITMLALTNAPGSVT